MTMFFYTFLAVPTPDAKEFHDSGGAYVNCWIRSEAATATRRKRAPRT